TMPLRMFGEDALFLRGGFGGDEEGGDDLVVVDVCVETLVVRDAGVVQGAKLREISDGQKAGGGMGGCEWGLRRLERFQKWERFGDGR
ncbi:MAG: hypothetical protein Q9211_006701, partial [Gyalolechia sp. 1 TL-2023]